MKINLKLLAILFLCSTFSLLKAKTYVADKTIPLPSDGRYDYPAIDSVNNGLYVSHGTAVNVII